jgi:hypothetical protein
MTLFEFESHWRRLTPDCVLTHPASVRLEDGSRYCTTVCVIEGGNMVLTEPRVMKIANAHEASRIVITDPDA